MRANAAFRWIGVTALLLGAAGNATAQPAPASPAGQVGFERRPSLSLQDESVQADVIITRMQRTAATIRGQLDSARQARDVVRSLCLSDKLSQVDVATRSARDRQAALQAAVQRRDSELANHEFTIMTVLRQRAEQLTAEANQCIGEEVAFVGATNVVTTIAPNIPDVGGNPGDTPGGEAPGSSTINAPPPCSQSCNM